MKTAARLEQSIAGNQTIWITLFVLASFLIFCAAGGDLVHWAYLGFEIIMPFCVTIMVCEWVRTLSDPIIDVILVHTKSLFGWVVKRFLTIFGLSGILCILGMIFMRMFLYEFSLPEMLLAFFGTAFLLSSLGVLSSFFSRQPHVSTCVCGVFCLFSWIVNDWVRFPLVARVYPFIRFVANDSSMWLANKITLIGLGAILWAVVYGKCRRRRFNI